MYLRRFTSGVKSILKLYRSKSIVTDGRAGERRGRGYKVPGARHVLRGLSQVLRGPAFIKLFSLERDTREEMLEKLRLRYEIFFLETNEKIRIKFWYRGQRWKPVASTGTGRVEALRPEQGTSQQVQLLCHSDPRLARFSYLVVADR